MPRAAVSESCGTWSPAFGGADDFIAYEENGSLLGSDGFARIVVPGDLRGGRYVSNLVSLDVLSAVPEPATLSLLLPLALGCVLLARRRKAGGGAIGM